MARTRNIRIINFYAKITEKRFFFVTFQAKKIVKINILTLFFSSGHTHICEKCDKFFLRIVLIILKKASTQAKARKQAKQLFREKCV